VATLYYREEREEHSVTQVADLLGLSEAAVRQPVWRARARLRDER
jgi:predicted transcriptional regulator